MSVWSSIVGQKPVVDLLREVSTSQTQKLAQSWLICGPAGSGRSNVARAFAAALISPDHGLSDVPTAETKQVLAGTHPDVSILTTSGVTISIDSVRELIEQSEQMPTLGPWRVIIIEDVDRMLERTTNVLLKEIEEPSAHTIWILCAPSAQDVLPTIRSRTRVLTLGLPTNTQVCEFLTQRYQVEPNVAKRAARLSEGHIGIAKLYATNEHVMSDRDELVVGVLSLRKASQAVLLAGKIIDASKSQAQEDVEASVAAKEAEFRRINGLKEGERIPPKLRGAFNAIGKKDEIKRQVTRRSRDVLDRALTTIASVYRDVCVLQNNAEEAVGLINLENRAAITELSVLLSRAKAVNCIDQVALARKRLEGNGNPTLVFEALLCVLLP